MIQLFWIIQNSLENWKKVDKWVSHELNENQRNCHFEISPSLLCATKKIHRNHTLTCDETWIIYDNRQHSAQCHNEALQKFPKSKLHGQKVMVIVWWSDEIHKKLLEKYPIGHTQFTDHSEQVKQLRLWESASSALFARSITYYYYFSST